MLVLIAQITSAFAALFVVVYGLRLLRAWGHHEQESARDAVLLSVSVSKANEKQPIVAEQIFSILHGIHHGLSRWDRLMGRTQERISFEIANVDEQIRFYIHTPRTYQNFVENQIYAQYPDVEIAVVDDYAAAPPADIRSAVHAATSGEVSAETAIAQLQASLAAPAGQPFEAIDYFAHAAVAELGLTNLDLFPIKRYGQFEDKINQTTVDPLNGITSTIAKLPNPADRAMLQIVVRPLGDDWRQRAMKYAPLTGKQLFFGIDSLKEKYIAALVSGSILVKWMMLPLHLIAFFGGAFRTSGEEEAKPSKDAVMSAETRSGHDNESASKACADKVSRLPYEVSIRIAYVPATPDSRAASQKVREIAGSFKQFNQPHLNGFAIRAVGGRELFELYRQRAIADPFVMNVEELATLYHMPNDGVRTPNIAWVTSKKLEPPVNLPNPAKESELTALGKTNYRGVDKLFGIRTEDRRRHVYIIGKTGMGKSTLLENMILSDIKEGKGVAVVDPHGDLAEHVLDNIPSYRTNDVVVFDPSDRDFPVAFNMLENIDPQMSSVVASGLVGIFKKLYADSWGPRLEHILRNTILSLLEYPGTTMLGIPRMLVDREFRRMVTKKVTDPVVKRFWIDEFEAMQPKQLTEAVAPIQNKVGQFLSSSIIRNIVGQPKSMIDLRFAMDTGKIVVCNLSKGKIGEDNSSLLGSMLITKFQLDAMSRANIPEKDRKDFYLYVDEFQNFATDSFATILSEARKYRLSLTMANQYIAQMSDEVKEAVFGNVGTVMTFQVGYDDAEYISKQFSEVILPNDLVQMPKYSLYTKLLVDGMPTQPFSASTLPPINDVHIEENRREKVVKLSRERYAQKREVVESKIMRWSMSDEEKDERKSLPEKKTPEKKELPVAPKETVKKLPSPEVASQPAVPAPKATKPAAPEPETPKKTDDKSQRVETAQPARAPHASEQPSKSREAPKPTSPREGLGEGRREHVAPAGAQNGGKATSQTNVQSAPQMGEKSRTARQPDGQAVGVLGQSKSVPHTLEQPSKQREAPKSLSSREGRREHVVSGGEKQNNGEPALRAAREASSHTARQSDGQTAAPTQPQAATNSPSQFQQSTTSQPQQAATPSQPASQSQPRSASAQPQATFGQQPAAMPQSHYQQPVQPQPVVQPQQVAAPQPTSQPRPAPTQPQPFANASQPAPSPASAAATPQQPVTPSPMNPAQPQLTPQQQQQVEQYMIYYQQYYHLQPAHARHAALTAVMQQQAVQPQQYGQPVAPQPVQAQPLRPHMPQPAPVQQPLTAPTGGYQLPPIRPTPTQPPVNTVTPTAPAAPLPPMPPATPEL